MAIDPDPESEGLFDTVECTACAGQGATPAIVGAFLPDRIEYIVREEDSPEALERMAKRGFTLVRLVRTDGKGADGADLRDD
jgi:hypothetical protein